LVMILAGVHVVCRGHFLVQNLKSMAITVSGRGFVCRTSYVKSLREWLFHT